MSIRRKLHTDDHCKHYLYSKNYGYAMQCGIIEIPKEYDSKMARVMLSSDIHSQYCNLTVLPRKASYDYGEIKINTYYLHIWYYKYDLDRYWCSYGINDKWDKKIVSNYDISKNDEIEFYKELNGRVRRPNQWPAVWDEKITKLSRKGCIVDITKIKDENFKHMMSLREFSGISGYGHNIDIIESIENDNDFIDIKWKNSITDTDKRTVNMYNHKENLDLDYYSHGSWTWGLNANDYYYNRAQRKDIRLLKRALDDDHDDDNKEAAGEPFALKDKDIINVAINNEKSELFFYKNNNKRNIIGNVKQKLDFDKYRYLFAMSSITCSCKDGHPHGFEYDVSVHL